MLVKMWLWWAQGCALALMAVGLSYLISDRFNTKGPVSIHSQQQLLTERVPIGGKLLYTIKVDRKESCPGFVVDLWQRSLPNGSREQIINSRAIATSQIAVTPVLKMSVDLPEAVTIGRWFFASTLNSDCPTRRDVVDKIAEFTIEVIPAEDKK